MSKGVWVGGSRKVWTSTRSQSVKRTDKLFIVVSEGMGIITLE